MNNEAVESTFMQNVQQYNNLKMNSFIKNNKTFKQNEKKNPVNNDLIENL